MQNDETLRPFRTIAILPFASATGGDGHGELSRGMALLLEKRLGSIPGVRPLLQSFFVTGQDAPEDRRWLQTSSLWSVEEALALPVMMSGEAEFVLQGRFVWEAETVSIEMQLIGAEAGFPIAHETVEGSADDLVRTFFRALFPIASELTSSVAVGRISSRMPTRSSDAFRQYLLGNGYMQHAHESHGREGPAASLAALSHYIDALQSDLDYLEAADAAEGAARLTMAEHPEQTSEVLAALGRVELGATYPVFRQVQGLALTQTGEREAGHTLLEGFLRSEPGSQHARETIAVLAGTSTDPQRLRSVLRDVLARNPEQPEGWEVLARLHEAAGSYVEATECWRRALLEDPERPLALAGYGKGLLRRRDFLRASKVLALACADSAAPMELQLAQVEALAGAGEALAADGAALTLAEEHPEVRAAWLLLARIRALRGDRDAARWCLGRARTLMDSRDQADDQAMLEFHLLHPVEHAEFRRLERLSGSTPAHAQLVTTRLVKAPFSDVQHPDLWRVRGRYAALAARYPIALDAQRLVVEHPTATAQDRATLLRYESAAAQAEATLVFETSQANVASGFKLPSAPKFSLWQRLLRAIGR
jgi:tetratricopeptide (TPR) repeat protein/TolB-like protein